jgi:hypothetical protein
VAAILNFSTDGGDRHLFMDAIKAGAFDAKSLRARFALTGSAKDAKITLPDSLDGEVRVESSGVRILLRAPYARFGELQGRWESGRTAGGAWVDLVLVDGDPAAINLLEISPAALALTVHMQSDGDPEEHGPEPHVTGDGGMLKLEWDGLEVQSPPTPAPARGLQGTSIQKVAPR